MSKSKKLILPLIMSSLMLFSGARIITSLNNVQVNRFRNYSKLQAEEVGKISVDVTFIDKEGNEIDLGVYEGETVGEVIKEVTKENGKLFYYECPDGCIFYSLQTEKEYTSSSLDTNASLPSDFTLQVRPKEHVTSTRADINFLENISSVKPGEEFTIVITAESQRTGTYWSSIDISIYSEFFDNYVSYVSSSIELEDDTIFNNVNGQTFEKSTTPYSYHAALSFDNDSESTTYQLSKLVKINVTFKLSEEAEDIYNTNVGFYTYPTGNKFVYSNGSTDTRTAVKTNHTRSNQLAFTVDHGENTITYKSGTRSSGKDYKEIKIFNQETLPDYSPYTLSTNSFTGYGLTQIGWTTTDGGEKEYDFGEIYTLNEDLVLYPAWEGTVYKIKFNSNGGSEVPAISSLAGFEIFEPEKPTRDGYTFKGWYLDNETFLNKYEFTTMPMEFFTLYAKWSRNLLQLDEDLVDAYEYIVINQHPEDYIDGDEEYHSNYYYRETYESVGLVHGEEEEGTRVVLGKVNVQTSIKEFLIHFKNEPENVRITDVDGNIVFDRGEVPETIRGSLTSEEFIESEDAFVITTGVKVELVVEDEAKDTIYVSVLGDINCDGYISADDYGKLRERIKTSTVNDYDLEVVLACYVFNDGSYEKYLFAEEYETLRQVSKGNAKENLVPYLSRNTNFNIKDSENNNSSNDTEKDNETTNEKTNRNNVVYYKKED